MGLRRKLVAGGAAIGISILTVIVTATPAHAEPFLGQPLPFANVGGKCVSVRPDGSGFTANGLRIWQQPCTGTPEQTWTILSAGRGGIHGFGDYAHFLIQNRLSTKCLDVTDGRAANGTPIQQWDCGSSTSMLWALFTDTAGELQVVNVRNGMCLDVTDGSRESGAMLQEYECINPNPAQRFVQRVPNPPPLLLTVPNVIGESCTQARADVAASGLVGTCLGAGRFVGSQSPPPGSRVVAGSVVSLVMTSAAP